ncbi:GNAT family N-acetyltransferase [Pedobacter sp.]|uniref:GNAT family N-acetyltransferase n=1 Tax=Pedobacter sp. TaxID=1411316 RepID=UPI0031D61483
MEIIQLNTVTESQALEIHVLSNQLGYENDTVLLFNRLKQIVKLNDHAVFIAKQNDKIVGWLHCLVCLRVESPLFVEVTGLVVDEHMRGQQIGKKLIEASKHWGRHQNISIMRVRCNVIRIESHRFYQTLGFISNKEQKVFEMNL